MGASKSLAMKLERINDLQMDVTDLDRSGRWYRRILGLRLLAERADGTRELRSASGDFTLRLVAGTPARSRQLRFGVRVDDRPTVRRWRSHVDASGAFANPITERDGSYGFTLADPDGYLLEFYTDAAEA